MKTKIFLLLFPICGVLNAAPEKHWPAWRGPDSSGSSEGGSYPTKLSGTENLIWKALLPGKGCSTPVVWGERILLTCPVDGKDAVLGFDWEGEKLWQPTIGPERKGKHRNGASSASSKAKTSQVSISPAKSFGRPTFPNTARTPSTGTSAPPPSSRRSMSS